QERNGKVAAANQKQCQPEKCQGAQTTAQQPYDNERDQIQQNTQQLRLVAHSEYAIIVGQIGREQANKTLAAIGASFQIAGQPARGAQQHNGWRQKPGHAAKGNSL